MKVGVFYSVETYVSVATPMSNFCEIPFGLSYVATALRTANHTVELIVTTNDSNLEEIVSGFITSFKPSLICLTAVTTQYPAMVELARIVKGIDSSIYIILGGAYAILSPDTAISPGCFDAICTGEGEDSIITLVNMLEQGTRPSGIPNLWFRDPGTGEIEKNKNALFIENLDALPIIDRTLWEKWVVRHDIHALLLGRGCPFRCTYCSNHILAETSEGKYVRFRSYENVISELKGMVARFPTMKRVYFEVETFGANLKYALGLCDALYEFNTTLDEPLLYGINLAITKKVSRNHELIQAMKKANFGWINIGLESGSYRIRKEVLRRPEYSNEELAAFSLAARETGINIHLFIIMGIPTEQLSDYRETIQAARACMPTDCFISIFYPYPGTHLHTMAMELGLIGEKTLDHKSERRVACLDLPHFSKHRIRYEFIVAKYKIFKGRLPLMNLIALVGRNILGGFPMLDHLLRYFVYKNAIGTFIRRKYALSVLHR